MNDRQPGRCDGCGRPFTDHWNEFYSEQYELQMLPLGETIHGRPFIALCPPGLCEEGDR